MTTQQAYQPSHHMPRRPSGSLTALGILSIVYAVFFNLCGSLVGLSFPLWGPAFFEFLEANIPDAPPLGELFAGPMMWYSVFAILAGLTLGVSFLAGGIGLLKLRAWGRKLLMAASVARIVWCIISFLVSLIFMLPWVIEMMEQQTHNAHQVVGQVVATVVGMAFQLALPIVLLVFLNRPSIIEQFEPPPDYAIGV